jgi:hypothetical protein
MSVIFTFQLFPREMWLLYLRLQRLPLSAHSSAVWHRPHVDRTVKTHMLSQPSLLACVQTHGQYRPYSIGLTVLSSSLP